MFLKEDIASYFKGSHLYGKKGDKVELISEHGNILIVEGSNKIRFPVRKDEIIDNSIPTKTDDNKSIIHEVQARKVKPKSTAKPAPLKQPDLFL